MLFEEAAEVADLGFDGGPAGVGDVVARGVIEVFSGLTGLAFFEQAGGDEGRQVLGEQAGDVEPVDRAALLGAREAEEGLDGEVTDHGKMC